MNEGTLTKFFVFLESLKELNLSQTKEVIRARENIEN
jgi:hypothetical protein